MSLHRRIDSAAPIAARTPHSAASRLDYVAAARILVRLGRRDGLDPGRIAGRAIDRLPKPNVISCVSATSKKVP